MGLSNLAGKLCDYLRKIPIALTDQVASVIEDLTNRGACQPVNRVIPPTSTLNQRKARFPPPGSFMLTFLVPLNVRTC